MDKDLLLKKELLILAGQLARLSDEEVLSQQDVENLTHQQLVDLKRDLRDLLRTIGGGRGN